MRAALLAMALLAAPCGGAALAQEATEAAPASLPFHVELPAGFAVQKRPPGPDFDVYDIVAGGKGFAGIYVGHAASFPIVDDEDVRLEKRSDGLTVALRGKGKEAYVGEYLWTDKKTGQEIHVWGQYGDGIDPKVVQAIMASVKPRT